jgi:hypothetical protein
LSANQVYLSILKEIDRNVLPFIHRRMTITYWPAQRGDDVPMLVGKGQIAGKAYPVHVFTIFVHDLNVTVIGTYDATALSVPLSAPDCMEKIQAVIHRLQAEVQDDAWDEYPTSCIKCRYAREYYQDEHEDEYMCEHHDITHKRMRVQPFGSPPKWCPITGNPEVLQ